MRTTGTPVAFLPRYLFRILFPFFFRRFNIEIRRRRNCALRGFRDAGFEVIYSGLHQSPEQIVATAIQEGVDGIGISMLSGAHDYIFPKVIELLRQKGAEAIIVFGGGIIPEDDIPALTEIGVKRVFTPGTSIEEAVTWVHENIDPHS